MASILFIKSELFCFAPPGIILNFIKSPPDLMLVRHPPLKLKFIVVRTSLRSFFVLTENLLVQVKFTYGKSFQMLKMSTIPPLCNF